jgi:hypothetical protein
MLPLDVVDVQHSPRAGEYANVRLTRLLAGPAITRLHRALSGALAEELGEASEEFAESVHR